MDSKRAWTGYVAIRLLTFAVPFAAVMLALPVWQWNWVLGIVVGALISLLVSYVFLRPMSERMSTDIAEFRTRRDTRTADDRVEDEELDGTAPAATEDTDGDEEPDEDAEGDEPDETSSVASDAEADSEEPTDPTPRTDDEDDEDGTAASRN